MAQKKPGEGRLPYSFDLLYDIKTMEDIETVLKDDPFRNDVDIPELEDLMRHYGVEFPSWYTPTTDPTFPKVVWIDKNGGYLTYAPDPAEAYQYQRMHRF